MAAAVAVYSSGSATEIALVWFKMSGKLPGWGPVGLSGRFVSHVDGVVSSVARRARRMKCDDGGLWPSRER